MDTQTKNITSQKPDQSNKRRGMLWVLLVIIVILLAAVSYLGWLAWSLNTQNTTLSKDKSSAQNKVTDLTAQLAAAQKASTASVITTPCPCTPIAASQSLKDNIHDAINSKNTAALQGYMASSVKVVIAASDHSATDTPAQAVSELDYLNSAVSPWNFSIDGATLTSWKSHFYGQYFSGTSYAGRAASDQVVSFDFDCNGKIDQIFMAASSDLLTQ